MLFDWNYRWDLDVDICPADSLLVEWAKFRNISNKRVYHMGTGAHHLVGIELAKMNNCVQAITAAPSEYKAWIDLAIDHPELGQHYKPVFGDIYQIEARQFGRFDVVSLFHLGEFSNEIRGQYQGLSDKEVIEIFYDQLDRGGVMLFYENSYGFEKISDLIERYDKDRLFKEREDYRSLRAYTKS